MSVGFPAHLYLDDFGFLLRCAFDHEAYHVGSSAKEKTGWRDVDVVVILPDEVFSSMGLGDPISDINRHENLKWRAFSKAFSELGTKMIGYPVDFKLQSLTEANNKDTHKGYRYCIGTRCWAGYQNMFVDGADQTPLCTHLADQISKSIHDHDDV